MKLQRYQTIHTNTQTLELTFWILSFTYTLKVN